MNIRPLLFVAAFGITCAAAVISAQARTSTKNFVQNASVGNTFEIDSSKLALDKSQNKDIKSFAQRMIDDHTKAGDELHDALDKARLDAAMAPDKLDGKRQRIYDKLEKASGSDFDRQYVDAQVTAHDDTVKLFDDYARHGDNAQLKDFASRTLPTLKSHQRSADKLKSTL